MLSLIEDTAHLSFHGLFAHVFRGYKAVVALLQTLALFLFQCETQTNGEF